MWARSYTFRALLAIGLLVAFYLVALAIALGLLAIPYLEYTSLGRLHIKLALVCVVGSGVILWSLVPRRVPFEPPGPLLSESEQPRLFALLREVARKMGTEVPSEVYLVPDVNAFVTQRGGFLGFGSRRVMGIGLPLLAVANVSELRAILTHEYGHYAGGETRLGSFIYATRAAMGRTLHNLEQSGSALLHKPFEWMLQAYLRLTQAISRQQELAADEWSVRLNGQAAHTSALQLAGVHGTGFSFFLRDEVQPLVSSGMVPDNVFEGYRRFLRSSTWQKLQPKIADSLRKEASDPYDSHPALEERLAFARKLQAPEVPVDDTPAWTLLSEPQALEVRFSEALRGESHELVSWDGMASAWAKMWGRMADRAQSRVPELKLGNLPELVSKPEALEQFAESVVPRMRGYRMPDRQEEVRGVASRYLGAWLGSVLSHNGWHCHTAPGEPLVLVHQGEQVDTMDLARRLVEGTLPPEELQRLAARTGMGPEVSWPVEEQVRRACLDRSAPVELKPGPKYTEVVTSLAEVFLPRCCALCCGPGEYVADVPHTLSSLLGSDRQFVFKLALCETHRSEGSKAFKVSKFDEKSQQITLQVYNAEYARLIDQANA